MRRTIHADPRKAQRKNRRETRKLLPSNFQFALEDKAQEVEVVRSSDGQKRQMVDVNEHATMVAELEEAKQMNVEQGEQIVTLEEDLMELMEIVEKLVNGTLP